MQEKRQGNDSSGKRSSRLLQAIFLVWAVTSTDCGTNEIVLTKLIAEMWEHRDITKNTSGQKIRPHQAKPTVLPDYLNHFIWR